MKRSPGTDAHLAWDRHWSTDEVRREWLVAEPAVVQIVPRLVERRVQDVLDIGCGVGRHALFLAQQGFTCTALDASPTGLAHARSAAADAGLDIRFLEGQFTELPLADASIDYALAWNVIYHGVRASICQAINEVDRVLRPGGLFQGTMLATRHPKFGKGVEIEPNTFVLEEGDASDKAHPHFYCDAAGFLGLFGAFALLELSDRSQPRSGHHWEFVVEKPR